MSSTLGEKLRQAREERGISISEVAEQTRISPIYLESIENDDYRNLPGGIFNKGFVKSFAKYVGINEQEALSDYSRLIASAAAPVEEEPRRYRPEVLTDDRSHSSSLPTIIVAVVILALMTGGVLFLVNYLRRPSEPSAANVNAVQTNTVADAEPTPETPSSTETPSMETLKVEFKTGSQPVRLTATVDGTKSDDVVAAGSSKTFEPKESLTLNYNRWNSSVVQLTINGKEIKLPTEPLDSPKSQRIEFTISEDNLADIWSSGSIGPRTSASRETSDAPAANTRPAATPAPKASPKPSSNTASNSAPATTKPAIRTQPTPKSTVITIPPRPGRTP